MINIQHSNSCIIFLWCLYFWADSFSFARSLIFCCEVEGLTWHDMETNLVCKSNESWKSFCLIVHWVLATCSATQGSSVRFCVWLVPAHHLHTHQHAKHLTRICGHTAALWSFPTNMSTNEKWQSCLDGIQYYSQYSTVLQSFIA